MYSYIHTNIHTPCNLYVAFFNTLNMANMVCTPNSPSVLPHFLQLGRAILLVLAKGCGTHTQKSRRAYCLGDRGTSVLETAEPQDQSSLSAQQLPRVSWIHRFYVSQK